MAKTEVEQAREVLKEMNKMVFHDFTFQLTHAESFACAIEDFIDAKLNEFRKDLIDRIGKTGEHAEQ